MKSIISLLNEKLNYSFVFIFKVNNIDTEVNVECNENLNSENIKAEKIELSLKRSLKHLELINHLQSCELEKCSKYFPIDFLNELENAKYDARINAIKTSTKIVTNAA